MYFVYILFKQCFSKPDTGLRVIPRSLRLYTSQSPGDKRLAVPLLPVLLNVYLFNAVSRLSIYPMEV